eukprot:6927519-Pyramimonas_sp.AAC.1
MILSPEVGCNTRGQGLGFQDSLPDLKVCHHIIHQALVQIRRCDLAPLYWHRSRGVSLYKNDMSGPRGRRLIHALPSIGKAWYARRLPLTLPPQDHGFARHRRREDAVMSVMAMGFRLRQAGWSYAITMKDLSNAFGSTDWKALDTVIQEHSAPEDRVLCRQRYRLSVVEVETTTGPLLLKTGCGGVMGDPFNVQGFAGAFVKPVSDWAQKVREEIPTTSLLESLWCGVKVDMSYQKYADDLLRLIPLCKGEGMEEVFDSLNKIDDILDDSLATTGYVQNKTKQVTQFYIAGP